MHVFTADDIRLCKFGDMGYNIWGGEFAKTVAFIAAVLAQLKYAPKCVDWGFAPNQTGKLSSPHAYSGRLN